MVCILFELAVASSWSHCTFEQIGWKPPRMV